MRRKHWSKKNAAQGFHDQKQAEKEKAETALKGAEQASEASKAEVQEVSGKKEAFEAEVEQVLPALKEGNFAPKDWRLRQKAIARLSHLLEQSDAPESMVAGAQLAFKDKPESRGQFAVKTVEATEACLKTYSQALAQAIIGASEKSEELRGDVVAKEEVAKASQSEYEAAMDALITADNEWADAESEVVGLKKSIQGFGPREEDLAAELRGRQTSFERFQELMRQFESFRDQLPAPALEVVAEGVEATTSTPAAEGEEAEVPVEGAEATTSTLAAGGEQA